MSSDDLDGSGLSPYPVGMKAQAGGGVAVFMGVLLLVFTPSVPPHPGLDIHQMARVFIGIGIFLLAAGTLARWYYSR